ncbi:HNH endonuclease family protein [Novacetimonas pomaceti]|uniref:hypothetical protein n=1 Tax=Novacetimonas pomaceti TaxID=2021998 RepID=UPI001057FCAD|nr:hypothetical protein [Novacetimonas pomaceti]
MILVTKPITPPKKLRLATVATTALNTTYDTAQSSYDTGIKKFNFDSNIYGDTTVKAALKKAQNKKCCYCESIFDANYSGDVEHYRPKGAIGSGKSKILPGYYWLAYSWSNLFYACAACNQYSKRTAFPLADETRRAHNHHCNIKLEDPLILNPSGSSDPREHIHFNGDVPIWKSAAGKTTISSIKLDREGLLLRRRQHFKLLDALLNIIKSLQNSTESDQIVIVSEARADLKRAVQKDAEFSAASSDYLEPHRNLWDV